MQPLGDALELLQHPPGVRSVLLADKDEERSCSPAVCVVPVQRGTVRVCGELLGGTVPVSHCQRLRELRFPPGLLPVTSGWQQMQLRGDAARPLPRWLAVGAEGLYQEGPACW